MKKKYLFFFFFLACTSLYSQIIIHGTVIDSLTRKPIIGAAVFFNKTSIWDITNKKGHFELYLEKQMSVPLIISYLGYERVVLNNPFSQDSWEIYLNKANTELQPVVLTGAVEVHHQENQAKLEKHTSPNRSRFRAMFTRFFIGSGEASKKTQIRNAEVLRFTYDSIENAVSVYAERPIKIKNEYLKYQIVYTLDTARIKFSQHKEFNMLIPSTFSIAGKFFFKDLLDPQKRNRRFHRRRQEAYLGSVLHFMRALAKNKLEKEGFTVYTLEKLEKTEEREEKIYQKPVLFVYEEHRHFTEVIPPAFFHILYGKTHTSVHAKQNFGIDRLGRFFPWYALKFTGAMGKTGVSSALPLDFKIEE